MPDDEDELTELQEAYARNRAYAKPGSYQTKLSPLQEKEFQGWLYKNNIRYDLHWPPDQSMQTYDMRGFWKAMLAGDPIAAQDPLTFHFPDKWKTPYHPRFSNQSMYATPDAPRWQGEVLVDKDGKLIYSPPPAMPLQ